MATVLFITTIHKKVDLTHKEQKTKKASYVTTLVIL